MGVIDGVFFQNSKFILQLKYTPTRNLNFVLVTLLDKFRFNINHRNLFAKKDKLLLATSGGVDSVALCHLCYRAGFDFALAHCNFQLRSKDSDRDEAFVKELAQKFDVPVFSIKFDTIEFANERKISTQVAARELRYAWFETVREQHSFDYILTAHHADDNIETLLMNLFRGTGIKGLTGIKEKHGKIVRPLLFARRYELEIFVQQEQLPFVQDESNLHDDYTRNYFRNTVVPQVTKVFADAPDNLLANIERFKEAEILYRVSIEQFKKKLIVQKGDDLYIPILLLQKTPACKTVLFEILSEYKFSSAQVPEVLNLLNSESGKYVQSSSHRVIKNRNHLIITRLAAGSPSLVVIEAEGVLPFANGNLILEIIENKDFKILPGADWACVDAAAISFPLLLRPWKQGDYFYPLGMLKKKKLSRFFIDKKLSLVEKEKIWVVESQKKIIWILGHRIDERVKIKPTSQKILTIRYLTPK